MGLRFAQHGPCACIYIRRVDAFRNIKSCFPSTSSKPHLFRFPFSMLMYTPCPSPNEYICVKDCDAVHSPESRQHGEAFRCCAWRPGLATLNSVSVTWELGDHFTVDVPFQENIKNGKRTGWGCSATGRFGGRGRMFTQRTRYASVSLHLLNRVSKFGTKRFNLLLPSSRRRLKGNLGLEVGPCLEDAMCAFYE